MRMKAASMATDVPCYRSITVETYCCPAFDSSAPTKMHSCSGLVNNLLQQRIFSRGASEFRPDALSERNSQLSLSGAFFYFIP